MKIFVLLSLLSYVCFVAATDGFHCGVNWLHQSKAIQTTERFVPTKRQLGVPFNINLNVVGSAPPEFVSEFERAIQIWEELLSNTTLSEEINIDFSVDDLEPGVIGATRTEDMFCAYGGVNGYRSLIEAHTGQTFPTQNFLLGNTNLPAGLSLDPIDLAYTQKPAMKALGVPVDLDFGPSDGLITFSSAFAFDTDASDGINGNQIDFLTVAVHEIGHLLGFVSSVDFVDLLQDQVSVYPIGALDLFRFFSSDNFVDFQTTPRHMNPNGVNFHLLRDFDGSLIGELSQGTNAFPRSSPESNQASHWRDNANAGQATLGVMDPTLDFGEAVGTSENDDRAMFFLGYTPNQNVAPTLVSALVSRDAVTIQGFNFRGPVTCDIMSNVTLTDLPATLLDGNGIAVVDINQAVSLQGTAVCRNANSGDSNGQGLAEGAASSLMVNLFVLVSMSLLLLGF